MTCRAQPTYRIRSAWLLIAAFLPLSAGATAAQASARYLPRPSSDVQTIAVGERQYFILSEDPLAVPLLGPGTLSGFARVNFTPGEHETKAATLVFEGIGDRTIRIPLNFSPSNVAAWGDDRPGRPSGGRPFEVYVPAGAWTVRLSGQQPAPSLLTVLLYYQGPAQPGSATRRSAAAKPNPWRYRNEFGLEIIYDNNVLTQSPDYIAEWTRGGRPERYYLNKSDDLIIAPKLDFAADRRFFSWGNTRLRFVVKRYMYTQNPVKTNTDLDWYIRQFFSGGKSLELNYQYAPEQYIRHLGDRTPFADRTVALPSKPFRFTRNVASVQWRHSVNSTFNYSTLVIYKCRYYNKPFMENDIEAWEFRGVLGYRPHRRLRLTFDYSYEYATARAIDTVGETPATSNDGDGSYRRDLYRVGFDWTTRWARPILDSIDGSWLFMDYYFPTERSMFDDPYHTGRRDKNGRVTLRINRRLTSALRVYASFRYSDRIVESPWPGDITLDKDYTQQRYWLGMTYSF